jgi:nickel/cobalt transporter (NicO) family protein
MISLIACVVLQALYPLDSKAARNPFISSKTSQVAPQKDPMSGYPAFLQPAMEKVALFQASIKQRMVSLTLQIRHQPLGRAFWGFMLLAFTYGAVHALGPGHGKIYTCSYFLSRPGTVKKVLIFVNLTMFTHVLSGTVLILFGALVLKTSGALTLENAGIYMERFSYILLVIAGLFISAKIIRENRNGNSHTYDLPNQTNLLLTALAVGLVPCPGAALILLFALTMGILTAGLWAMLCIAAGMTITSAIFAFGAMVFRKAFLGLFNKNQHLVTVTYLILSLGGALCISLFGSILLLGSF